jgi:hypothetical protein
MLARTLFSAVLLALSAAAAPASADNSLVVRASSPGSVWAGSVYHYPAVRANPRALGGLVLIARSGPDQGGDGDVCRAEADRARGRRPEHGLRHVDRRRYRRREVHKRVPPGGHRAHRLRRLGDLRPCVGRVPLRRTRLTLVGCSVLPVVAGRARHALRANDQERPVRDGDGDRDVQDHRDGHDQEQHDGPGLHADRLVVDAAVPAGRRVARRGLDRRQQPPELRHGAVYEHDSQALERCDHRYVARMIS